MIRLPCPRFPRWFVAGHHCRQSIEVRDHAAIDRLVEGEQPGLMGEELAYGDLLFALLRELWPVDGDALFVVQPAARMGDGQGHRGEPLGGRVNDDHRVLFPGLTRRLVSNTAPEVDNFLAAIVGAAGATELPTLREVLFER